jgi:ribonuclease VapC
MSAINVGEVYYFLIKRGHSAIAERWRQRSRTLPMRVDVPKDEHIWAAASLKAKFPISYADAFAAELGQRHGCAVMTGDPEFRSVAGLELDWVGR